MSESPLASLLSVGKESRTTTTTAKTSTVARDVVEAKKEADNIWKMLDDMAENDPEAYEKFVKEHAGDAARSLKRNSFVPRAGKVLKGYALRDGAFLKLFINICSHPGVQVPLGADGKHLDDNAPGWAARQIPLLVGKLRESEDKKGAACLVVDVVFNPWVLRRLDSPDAREEAFKQQVADLAASWVKQDYGIGANTSSYKYIRSVYKGGTGTNGATPLPFSLESHPVSEEMEDEDKAAASVKSSDKESKNVMSSPSSLLSHMRDREDVEEENDKSTAAEKKSDESSTRRRPLIQEIGAVTTTKETKKKKKTKSGGGGGSAIRKGFLFRKKNGERRKSASRLYPTSGSGEGKPAPSPYPWANVVDTRGMNQEMLRKTMSEYSETGTVTGCDEHITKATRVRGASKDSATAAATRKLPTQSEIRDLEKLMEIADPEIRSRGKAATTGGATTTTTMGNKRFVDDLCRVLNVSSDPSVASLGRSLQETGKRDNAGESVLEKGMRRVLEESRERKKKTVPEFTVDTSNDGEVVVRVKLPLLEGIGDVDLDINPRTLRLRHETYFLDAPLPFPIDPTRSKARFSKRRGELKVRMTRA